MSLIKIREALKKAKEETHGFSWVDEEFADLLILVAEYLLGQEHKECEHSIVPEGFMTLSEFEKKHKFVAANTLCKYCKDDDSFRDTCALFIYDKWFIEEKKALDFLMEKPFFKKRMERLGKSW